MKFSSQSLNFGKIDMSTLEKIFVKFHSLMDSSKNISNKIVTASSGIGFLMSQKALIINEINREKDTLMPHRFANDTRGDPMCPRRENSIAVMRKNIDAKSPSVRVPKIFDAILFEYYFFSDSKYFQKDECCSTICSSLTGNFDLNRKSDRVCCGKT
jgi:hypothetical protein